MRFQFNSHMKAALLIAATSVPSLIHAKQSRPSGLSMAEYNAILFTDINKEFEDSESLWIEATNIEWKRAKNSEAINLLPSQSDELQEIHHLRSPKKYSKSSQKGEYSFPYVVCEMSSDKSGFQSRNEVESHFGSDLLVLYNNKDKTCFLTDVSSSVAESAPSANMKVQPLLPEMKIAAGVVDKIYEKQSFKFEAVLCPGRVSTDRDGSEDRAKSIGLSIIKSMKHDSNNDEEISDTDRSENKASIMMERFLRTEEEWGGQSRDHKMTNRWKLWQGAFQNGIHSSHQCDDVFQRMFISSGYKGESFVVGVSEDGEEYSIPYHIASSECLLSLVASLATSREICHVGALGQLETLNAPSQWIIQSKIEDERPWFDVGLDGSGQVVAVSDTGIDMNNCYFWDSNGNVNRNGNVDDSKRKVIQYVPFLGFNDDKLIGHGTHVAATVAGRKASDGHTESTGIADGVAREAKVAFLDIGLLVKLVLTPNDVNKLFGPGQSAGAKIHSASWGAKNDNTYNAQSKSFDQWMYDNPDFLVVVAAGNSGSDKISQPPVYDIPYTVGAPATAKNIISVGATESWGSELNKPNMMGFDYIADFSSRGPTPDNRTKPDILAPGYNILSAKSHGRSNEYSCDNDNNGTRYMAGTSMAAPAVSGTAALIRQYFTQGWYPTGKPIPDNAMNPSAALIKAVLMNGANFVKGVNNNGTVTPVSPYDDAQNFGRISLVDSLRLDSWTGEDSIAAFVQDKKTILDGDESSFTVTVATSENCTSTKFSVTLVWTDLPAGVPSCARCLMNNLDLTVSKKHPEDVVVADDDDVIFFPNGLGNKDDLNNAERVQLNAESGDQFVVSVAGYNLVTASQEYALAMTGCFEVSE